MTKKTADVDDRDPVADHMGRLVTWGGAFGNFYGSVDAWGYRRSRRSICSRRRSVSVKWAEFHVTGPLIGRCPWGRRS